MSSPTIKEAVLNRRMLVCVFLGFSSGLPLYVLIQLVPAWLRTEGVSLGAIGFFALVQFPYNWKFFWAPIVDRYSLPFLGRRRGWIILTQVLLLISISTLGWFDPALSIWFIAYLALVVAFFSATQDVVIDAYRRELLPDIELGIGNSIHVQAYRFAGLVPGSLAMILSDHLPWNAVFMITAAFMLVGIFMTLFVGEAIEDPQQPRSLQDAVIQPFKEFFNRQGLNTALLILAFMVLYKLGDNMATALATPFYIDLGFSNTEIGSIAKFASLIAVFIGGIVGGIAMIKLGINKALWLFGMVQIVTILGFVWLAEAGNNPWILGLVVGLEYLGVGLGTAAFTAFIARTTAPVFAATQFALFTALAAVPRTFANAFTGVIVEQVGWTQFYLLCTALAIPGMLLLFRIAPWSATTQNIADQHYP